jgi:glycosyltransferase involved in cell wall biosynthesis
MTADRSVLLVLASSGWGGTERAFVDLANALAPRWRVTVAIPPDAVYAERLTGVRSIRHLRPGSRRNPLVLVHLRRLVRDVGADVVHTHAARATEMIYWVGRTTPLVHVATKHNTRDRWVFPRVRWVTAVSEQARRTIDRAGPVDVIYNGVTATDVGPVEKPDTFTLLAVGRLHPHKGFDTLVREVARLRFDFALEIAGEGPERHRLEALVREVGLTGRVRLLGHREDIARLMARSHALVVPSRTEGFSLALVEGLLHCDVVVSTRVGIAPEILPDELLVRSEDMADRLTEIHDRYDEFVERTARVRSVVGDRFSLAGTTAEYEKVYERAISRKEER